MPQVEIRKTNTISEYLNKSLFNPHFVCGDSLEILRTMDSESVDCVMTSPPYWGHRKYESGGIGQESHYKDYMHNLLLICAEIKRVVKPTGSFWLNLGDSYKNKNLVGIPWRIALSMCDEQGWILRNDVIWNKVKGGPDNSKDKLGNVHEHLFHFVIKSQKYYYDVDAIRNTPQTSKVVNGAIVTASGVSGIRYKRQIELSTELSEKEKKNAMMALEEKLQEVSDNKLSDFRMIIRGNQRTTHSDKEQVSGRARELQEKGFYFLRYHPNGSKPRDVWDILPEDTQKRKGHFAPYPEDLCKIPIIATCPHDGIVLDPFCGTGTTMLVAFQSGRKSIGIDTSEEYIQHAKSRCHILC